jgi:hypothetical protein
LEEALNLSSDSMLNDDGVRVKEFPLGRSRRVRVDGQLSEEVRVTSGVLQGSVLCPLLFLAYVIDVTVCLTCPTLVATILKLAISIDPSQGIYRRIRSRSVRPVTLFTEIIQLT